VGPTGPQGPTGVTGPQGIPAGIISAYGGTTAPTGWLICDGSAVNRATYSALFSAIGTDHGVGDGSTTFNLPNLKGRTIVGRDTSQTEFDTMGETGGAKTHTLSTPEIPAHTHTYVLASSSSSGYLNDTYAGFVPILQSSAANTGSTGGGGAHNNLQPYGVETWIIKT
jgi:microcystin-dependent protein